MSKREGVIAAAVRADFLAVDADHGLPIHGAEVQQQALAAGQVRAKRTCGDTRAIACRSSGFFTPDRADSTRKGTRILPSNFAGLAASSRSVIGVVPQAVEVRPFCADHLRPRIFGQRALRVHLGGPGGHQAARHRLPLGRGGAHAAGQGKDNRHRSRISLQPPGGLINNLISG